jgi:hypothetical protein
MKFILMGLIKSFTKEMGRSPNIGELNLLRREADIIQKQNTVIPFPQGGKDKISPFSPRPKEGEISVTIGGKTQNMTPEGIMDSLMKGRKETEAEMLERMNRQNKESVARLKQKKEKDLGDKLKDLPDDIDPDAMAIGGRAGFGKGDIVTKGIPFIIKEINKRFGKKAITTADKIDMPESSKLRDEFAKFNERNRELTDEEYAELAEEYGDSLPFLETVADKNRFLKEVKDYEDAMFRDYKAGRLDPKPGEPNRKRFLQKKMEEMEMSGDKKLMTQDEIEELADFEFRERTMNAEGGRIGFSGGGAGFAGNQMEHNDGIGSFGPGPTFKEPTIDTMPQPQLNPMMFNMPMMQRPMSQGIIGLKDGGPPNPGRRGFLKLMGGLAALPFVGKFFKPAAKVAETAAPVIQEGAKLGYENFMLLVDKIKRLGKPADNLATQERQRVIRYDGQNGNEYELVEDLTTGDISVTKDKSGFISTADDTIETIENRSTFIYKKGEDIVDTKTGKSKRTPDEYEEVTQTSSGPEDAFDDVTEIDDRAVNEVVNELKDVAPMDDLTLNQYLGPKSPRGKKAGGGLAYMLGE